MKRSCFLVLLLCLVLCLAACTGPKTPAEPTADPNMELAVTNVNAVSYILDMGVYRGTITAEITCPLAGDYTFSSKHTGDVTVSLKAGANTVAIPSSFDLLPDTGSMFIKISLSGTGGSTEADLVLPITYEPLGLKLTAPQYRDNFYPGQDSTKITGTVPAGKDVTVRLEGDGIKAQEVQVDANGNFSFDTPNFEMGGRATLTAVINGCEITKEIRNLEARKFTMTWIENGTLVVDGEPVIRRNVYAPTHHASTPDLEKYNADDLNETDAFVQVSLQMESFPNATVPHNETTKDDYPSDAILRHIDTIIANNKMRNFGYYYLSDEPEFRNFSKTYMQYIYEYIAKKDPYHVILIGSNNPSEYVNCADWIETDPYFGPRVLGDERTYKKPMYTIGKYVALVSKMEMPDKCIGIIPQCFASWPGWAGVYTEDRSDYPTFDEYICNVWVGLNNGAKSVWPYAGHDIHDRGQTYEGTRYIFASIEALENLLATGKRTILKQTQEYEAVLWELGEEKMFAVINLTNEEQTVTVDELAGTWDNFRHEGTITDTTFVLKPFETAIGTSQVRDEGLPTYDETAALINDIEADRLSSKSKLFGYWEYEDFDFKTSLEDRQQPAEHKLTDGNRHAYAWAQSSGKTMYVELNILTEKPTFNKIVVYGLNLEGMEFKVRMDGPDGELITPSVASVKVEENCTIITLSRSITPDSLRLEFPGGTGKRVELYEIEVY